VVFPVPGEVVGIGMEGGEGWDVDAVAVFGFEEESEVAAFVEVLFFDEDVEVVGEGPEAAVEEPVGRVKGFASRDWW
jgi:hypothetical protein